MSEIRTPNSVSELGHQHLANSLKCNISKKYFPFSSPPSSPAEIRTNAQNFTLKMIKIKTLPRCPKRILQSYQADTKFVINFTEEIVVKTKEKEFTTSIFPFLQSDHLLDQLKGKPKN